jgi:hypothetical protein
MIKYTLHCAEGHEFEAWFSNSASYDAQAARRAVSCPVCGSDEIAKAMMAPNVVSTKGRAVAAREPASLPAMPVEVAQLAREMRRHIQANAEYVGPRFAQEARKIHFEEAEKRGIYGVATVTEVKALLDDGIDCQPLPALPEDQN